MATHISKKINKVERIAQKKVDEIEKLEYQKYNKYFTQAVQFLKKEKVLMYGGNAINDLMPKKLKFYEEQSLPDIDIFAVNAEQVAIRIVKKFQKMGYTYSGYNEALHENTFKVFVEGMQILDITDISPSLYKKLSIGKVKGEHGLYIANPEFLRMTLHMLMAHPFNAYRWPKVYKRLVYFYKTFPMKKCQVKQPPAKTTTREIDPLLVDAFKQWIYKNGYILFSGPEVAKHYGNTSSSDQRNIYVATDDVVKSAQEFLLTIPQDVRTANNITISSLFPDDKMFVDDHVFITARGRNVFGIYKTAECLSYVDIKTDKVRIASFHTMCETYMSMAFVDKSEQVMCMVKLLGNIQNELLKKPQNKIVFDQFVLECYGPYEGQATLRRRHIERIVNRRKMKI